jgi:hypothetical protein
MVALLVFVLWIGIAPTGYFALMDSTVASLVNDVSSAAQSGPGIAGLFDSLGNVVASLR